MQTIDQTNHVTHKRAPRSHGHRFEEELARVCVEGLELRKYEGDPGVETCPGGGGSAGGEVEELLTAV